MAVRPDIVVRDPSGRTVLGVEVKARRGVDSGWAAQLRRNLLAHSPGVAAKYFMIVTSTDAYLWRQLLGEGASHRRPDAETTLQDLIGPDTASGTIDGRTLELLVQSWLSTATTSPEPTDLSDSARHFLIRSGLFTALRGAHVALEPV